MGWADPHIEKLQRGLTVQFRPRGNSMIPHVKSGQLVTVRPYVNDLHGTSPTLWTNRDIVLVRVKGNVYLHLIGAFKQEGGRTMYRIENASGHVNCPVSHRLAGGGGNPRA